MHAPAAKASLALYWISMAQRKQMDEHAFVGTLGLGATWTLTPRCRLRVARNERKLDPSSLAGHRPRIQLARVSYFRAVPGGRAKDRGGTRRVRTPEPALDLHLQRGPVPGNTLTATVMSTDHH